MFYKIVVECGHVGAGKTFDVVRYFQGNNIHEIIRKARKLPRVKSKKSSKAIKLIKNISEDEYLAGVSFEFIIKFI